MKYTLFRVQLQWHSPSWANSLNAAAKATGQRTNAQKDAQPAALERILLGDLLSVCNVCVWMCVCVFARVLLAR